MSVAAHHRGSATSLAKLAALLVTLPGVAAAQGLPSTPAKSGFDLGRSLGELLPVPGTASSDLEASFELWPSVAQARVLTSSSWPGRSGGNEAVVLLKLAGGPQEDSVPPEATVVSLVRAALPRVTRVRVVTVPAEGEAVATAPAAPVWVPVGPFLVAPSSAIGLRIVLALLSGAIVAMGLAGLAWRHGLVPGREAAPWKLPAPGGVGDPGGPARYGRPD